MYSARVQRPLPARKFSKHFNAAADSEMASRDGCDYSLGEGKGMCLKTCMQEDVQVCWNSAACTMGENEDTNMHASSQQVPPNFIRHSYAVLNFAQEACCSASFIMSKWYQYGVLFSIFYTFTYYHCVLLFFCTALIGLHCYHPCVDTVQICLLPEGECCSFLLRCGLFHYDPIPAAVLINYRGEISHIAPHWHLHFILQQELSPHPTPGGLCTKWFCLLK